MPFSIKSKKFLLPLAFITFLILLFFSVFEFSAVRGNGMTPSIRSGDRAIALKKFFNLNRSDVVVYSKGIETHVGRIIDVPGEAVRIENGNVYLDKRDPEKYKLIEDYLGSNVNTYGSFKGWKHIGPDRYLVLKDNKRSNVNMDEYIINKEDIIGVIIKTF